jgi:HAD superfamily hydrolase (TIGR01509 family)
MQIKAAIFDLDGTLIDSVAAYFKITDVILQNVHLAPVPKEVIVEFMKGGDEVWDMLIPENRKHEKQELIHEIMEVGKQIGWRIFQDEVRLIPGVTEVLTQLVSNNIKIGLVTSTHRKYLEGKLIPLKQNSVYDLIDAVITIEDAPRMKPEPDPLIECARRLNATEESCIYVGDAHVDMKAGKAAGMITIGVLTGIDDYETLLREGPYKILDSVYDLGEFLLREGTAQEEENSMV